MEVFKVGGEYGCVVQDEFYKMFTTASFSIFHDYQRREIYSKDPPRSEVVIEEVAHLDC